MSAMMLGGSRKISQLPPPVVEFLAEMMEKRYWFLVGDAPGADSFFQKVLHSAGYPRVVVFTSVGQARANAGQWEERYIDSGLKSQSAAKHTVKDRIMVSKADEGLMVWDGSSPGTLANVIDLFEAEKSSRIWTPDDDLLWTVDSPSHLEGLRCRFPEAASEAQKRLATYRRRISKSLPVAQSGLFDDEGLASA
ncbi:MAG: hypothetical protein EBS41_04670 [Actinobacteria bacterium]|nr:hypothetical protein [Actinomycetota bacterium]